MGTPTNYRRHLSRTSVTSDSPALVLLSNRRGPSGPLLVAAVLLVAAEGSPVGDEVPTEPHWVRRWGNWVTEDDYLLA
jgi:hypothetical protein